MAGTKNYVTDADVERIAVASAAKTAEALSEVLKQMSIQQDSATAALHALAEQLAAQQRQEAEAACKLSESLADVLKTLEAQMAPKPSWVKTTAAACCTGICNGIAAGVGAIRNGVATGLGWLAGKCAKPQEHQQPQQQA